MAILPGQTSLTYDFALTDIDLICRDAFFRCGRLNATVPGADLQSARASLNFVFSQWINRGLNLFTMTQIVLPIVNNQYIYAVPRYISKILEGIQLSTTRQLTGTATSSAGGTASAPFTANYTGPCTQTSADGNISFYFNSNNTALPYPITYVGILSNSTQIYKLTIQCSYLTSPSDGDWITVLQTSSQAYYFASGYTSNTSPATVWFALPITFTAPNWRIVETGGATLDIAQISFATPQIGKSQQLQPESRTDYTFQALNSAAGTAGTYWFNRSNPGQVRIYGTPSNSSYQLYAFNCARYIQDCDDFQNSIDANQRFIEPACAGLAAKLAEKYAPDRYEMLQAAAEKVYMEAGQEDTENVPSKVQFSLDGGFA